MRNLPAFLGPELLRRLQPGLAMVAGAALIAIAGVARTQSGPPQPPPGSQSQNQPTRALPVGSAATADSNGKMVAVTGVDVTGSSVLYLVDTERMCLGVYQATSTGSNQGIRFVGSRRIELDMQLDGFNDRSDYTYKDLKNEFEKNGLFPSGKDSESAPAKDN
jgi:hypothetical protein